MGEKPRESSVPSGAPSVRPSERPTPVADTMVDYAAYIEASERSNAHLTQTSNIDRERLLPLIARTVTTGATARPANLLDEVAREKARVSRMRRLRVGIGVAVTALAGLAALAFARAPSSSSQPAASSASASNVAAPASAPPPVASTAPAEVASAAGSADREARDALERLRTGLVGCIRLVRGLPGSSPAVPATLAELKGGYAPSPRDWKTAVWDCAHFEVAAPMTFQIQWQLVRPKVEGMAVAWLDADGDGVADRAYGFRIAFDAKGAMAVGDVAPVDASRPVVAR